MEANEHKTPVWFWIVSGLALVWNLLGVGAFVTEVTASPEKLIESLGQTNAAAVQARPVWATGLFAVAVFGGAIGCLLLLLRRRAAFWLLLVSLVAVVAQQVYWWGVLELAKSLAGGAWVMPIVIPIVAILLLWFARVAASKSWLK